MRLIQINFIIDGKWYYFTADGSMLVNAVTPDGRLVGADEVVIVI